MPTAPFPSTAASAAPVLGVERSLGGRRWVARAADDRLALGIAQRHGLPEVVGRILAARGIGLDEVPGFLAPRLRDQLPDPGRLKDMDVAAERVAGAVMQGETIAVFGDYDVDGGTSAALLSRFLRAVGGKCRIYVPDRQKEGYGPNRDALHRLKDEGASLVITVDCGTTAFEPLEEAAAGGLDIIVVDHHEAEPNLPRALAVVNPNRLDESRAYGHLAAVGVSFLLAVATNRALRDARWFANRPAPDLMEWLDLVALGTVCDAVPLVGVNRALVAQGIAIMARRGNAGLRALADVAGLNEPPGAYHLGFVLGPRINAGGRVGEAGLGARLLSCDDDREAAELARRLDALNRERQAIEAAVLGDATARAASIPETVVGPVLVAGDGWHPGVIGIVASRLVERFNRPACVVALDGAQGIGSGRSVAGIDLGAAVIAARQAGLLLKGGGHAMAAGFTVARDRIADLERFLAERIGPAIAALGQVRELSVDASLRPAAVNLDLLGAVGRVAPFGIGNPEPRFAIPAARLAWAGQAGENHVRLAIGDESGGRLKAIAFRALDGPLGPALLRHDGMPFHLVGKLRADSWQGRTGVQFVVEDAAPAW